MTMVELDLQGMFAVLTAEGLAEQLLKISGVTKADVDAETGKTHITYDEARTNLKAVRTHLVECGYHCAMEVLPDRLCDRAAAKRVE